MDLIVRQGDHMFTAGSGDEEGPAEDVIWVTFGIAQQTVIG